MRLRHSIVNTIAGLFTMMLILTSCVDSPAVSEFKTLDTAGWHQRDTVVFLIQRGDTTSLAPVITTHLNLMLRSLATSQLNGVTLLAEVVERTDPHCHRLASIPHRRVLSRDTIPFALTDDVPAASPSTGLSVRCLDSQRDIAVPLHPDRNYFLRITHIMRLDPIEGLAEVGYALAD